MGPVGGGDWVCLDCNGGSGLGGGELAHTSRAVPNVRHWARQVRNNVGVMRQGGTTGGGLLFVCGRLFAAGVLAEDDF